MQKYYFLKKSVKYKKYKIDKDSVGFETNKTKDKVTIYLIKYQLNFPIDNSLITPFDINKTGDNYKFKVCDRCFRFLPTSFFANNRIKKHAITKRPSCKDCRKIKEGVGISNQDRKVWNKKKPINYNLFECPICKKITIAGISKIVLDHNHHNGKVRGYLCESCNTGIGRFDDNSIIVANAIKWLKNN